MPASERQLRRSCQARLDALGVLAPYDLAELVQRVAESRGRPLRLLDLPGDASIGGDCSGMWIATATEDLVFVDQDAHEEHRDLIVAHELSHILCNHPADVALLADNLRTLAPMMDPARVLAALGRTKYDSSAECEAEMMGSLILARAERGTATVPGPSDAVSADAAAVLSRLTRALG